MIVIKKICRVLLIIWKIGKVYIDVKKYLTVNKSVEPVRKEQCSKSEKWPFMALHTFQFKFSIFYLNLNNFLLINK